MQPKNSPATQSPQISLNDFTADAPWQERNPPFDPITTDDQISGVELRELKTHTDQRGTLTVLNSEMFVQGSSSPHTYLVEALPGSVRAWTYHRTQSDRLAFTCGSFHVVLCDLRADSPTHGRLNHFMLGADNKAQLFIPPFVVNGIKNIGEHTAYYVNMPTRPYDPANPDKFRLPYDHPGAPFRFASHPPTG
jgi:dTDP-4-dehydrorhamnose 3,5-epimerase